MPLSLNNPKFIPFHQPSIGEEEISSVTNALRSLWLTTGPLTARFEEEFRSYIGSEHAIAVNSCTAALHLALEAINLTHDDEVILPTMTFAATAEVIHYFKARPVFVDSRSDSPHIDPGKIEQAITPKTKAIIPVHYGGQPCDMEAILDIAKRYQLKVIEDAAHALPSLYHGKKIGTLGDITCFSFYATKTITTGEGGMITTNEGEYVDRMRSLSLHGISRDGWDRYKKGGHWSYQIDAPGYKYNMTDIAAALGLEQLKKCTRFWEARQQIAKLYDEGFWDIPSIKRPSRPKEDQHSWHLYVIELELEQLTIDRADFINLLKEEKIGTSVHFIPLHRHPYYAKTYGYAPNDFPHASHFFERAISLPIYPALSSESVYRVIDQVKKIARQYRR